LLWFPCYGLRKRDERKKQEKKKLAKEAASDKDNREHIAEEVALHEQDEELMKKQHEAQIILKTGEALLTDGNTKLTSALQAMTFNWLQLLKQSLRQIRNRAIRQ